ncbi:MAG: cupin domain-containing protein [Abditibacteriales bacterium]|nr:cupin domain-containing protein [Abditibacteriales bacterium]MDW8364473.1 cupin domain-containing protein [Abditibacteriales bacterium]
MGLRIYDYRTDVRNVLVTPQIRARFLKMQPGQVARWHSHDLGHEVFLVLEGRARFEIDGEAAELGPGQMCVALADQIHQVSVVGEEPMAMYLSVTPHVQPTHTGRTAEGERLPLHFLPNSAYDVPPDDTPMDVLLDRHVAAAHALAAAAQRCAQVQREMTDKLKCAAIDNEAAAAARKTMWEAIYEVYRALPVLGEAWNALAPRLAK